MSSVDVSPAALAQAATAPGPWLVGIFICVLAVAELATGWIIAWSRNKQDTGGSVVRSWIAIGLVIGLTLLCAFSFVINDASLRNTLIGALTAAAGSAVAFYFSSRSAEDARKDLISTQVGTEVVPDLKNMTEADAASVLGKTSLKLEIDPASPIDRPNMKVDKQDPKAGSDSPKGTTVRAHFS
jgi:hypothetical protein